MPRATRRSVLRGGTLGAVAVSTGLWSPRPAAAAPELGWERAAFGSRVGEWFRLSSPDGSVLARLVAVDDLPSAARRGEADRFSAVFRGRRALPGGQGLFRLRAESGHILEAFVVPVDRGVRAPHYQLIVNRRVDRHRAPATSGGRHE